MGGRKVKQFSDRELLLQLLLSLPPKKTSTTSTPNVPVSTIGILSFRTQVGLVCFQNFACHIRHHELTPSSRLQYTYKVLMLGQLQTVL